MLLRLLEQKMTGRGEAIPHHARVSSILVPWLQDQNAKRGRACAHVIAREYDEANHGVDSLEVKASTIFFCPPADP